MIDEHFNGLYKICEEKKLVTGKVFGLYEYKTKQYTFRDDFIGKPVNWMQPINQYNRAYDVLMAYLPKEKGKCYEGLKIKNE